MTDAIERACEAMEAAATSLEAEIVDRYGGLQWHPSQEHKRNRDLEDVVNLRTSLTELRAMQERAVEVVSMGQEKHGDVARYVMVTGHEPTLPDLPFDAPALLIPLTGSPE